MLLDAKKCRRKRPREDNDDDDEQHQGTKRGKAHSLDRYPPHFWDTLSRAPITRRALRELNRRTQPAARAAKPLATLCLLRFNTRCLRQFASNGGPDLSALQGFSALPTVKASMSQSSAQSRKRDHASSTSTGSSTGKTRTTAPYSGEFEQKLIDLRVFQC